MRSHKRRWLLKTAGRWPWKSESAKECVTTHLPKQLALKMDGAEASCPYPTVESQRYFNISARTQRVGGSWWCALKGLCVGIPGAAISADLGGSSKYFGEAPKDRCGEGFRVNSR